jgi:hypothetical protein
MKKKPVFVFMMLMFIVSMGNRVFPARLGFLEGVLKPQMIKVSGSELFVVEGHNVFIYSLPELKLKKKLGKQGEGPGEFKLDPSRTAVINVFPGYILAESRHKVIWFSREGNFIKEKRKKPGIIQTMPIGKNFAVLKILYGPRGHNYFSINLYDSQFTEIKELYKQYFFTFEDKLFIMPDSLNYCICDNKIFIEESPDGFVIEVFDSEGKKLKRIQKPFEKIKVTAGDKEAAFNAFLQIPSVVRQIKQLGKQEMINRLKSQNLVYPDTFPAIQYMLADNKKLYTKTYRKKNNKEEYLIMDLTGNILKKVYLPAVKKVDFLVQMQGDKKYYHIHNDKYYYLQMMESEEDEGWEVHVHELK